MDCRLSLPVGTPLYSLLWQANTTGAGGASSGSSETRALFFPPPPSARSDSGATCSASHNALACWGFRAEAV